MTPAPTAPLSDVEDPRLATVCSLCQLHEMKVIGDSGVNYCPHCDTICRIGVQRGCPSCRNSGAQHR